MTEEVRSREVLSVLSSSLEADAPFEASPERRAATLTALSGLMIPGLKPHHPRRGWVSIALAAAVTLALGGGWLASRHVDGPTAEVTLKPGQSLRSQAGVLVSFPRESRASFESFSRSGSSSLGLLSGTAELQVPKQKEGDTFEVVTPDARIVVHGTRFSVEVLPTASGPHTCVKVQEGVVSVLRRASGERLKRGDSSGCEQSAPVVVTSPPPPSATAASEPTATPSVGGPREHRFLPPSALADANRLLRRGLELERDGNAPAAAAAFTQLLQRYPDSPIAAEARSSLERVQREHR